jgi:hypothetical protein
MDRNRDPAAQRRQVAAFIAPFDAHPPDSTLTRIVTHGSRLVPNDADDAQTSRVPVTPAGRASALQERQRSLRPRLRNPAPCRRSRLRQLHGAPPAKLARFISAKTKTPKRSFGVFVWLCQKSEIAYRSSWGAARRSTVARLTRAMARLKSAEACLDIDGRSSSSMLDGFAGARNDGSFIGPLSFLAIPPTASAGRNRAAANPVAGRQS